MDTAHTKLHTPAAPATRAARASFEIQLMLFLVLAAAAMGLCMALQAFGEWKMSAAPRMRKALAAVAPRRLDLVIAGVLLAAAPYRASMPDLPLIDGAVVTGLLVRVVMCQSALDRTTRMLTALAVVATILNAAYLFTGLPPRDVLLAVAMVVAGGKSALFI